MTDKIVNDAIRLNNLLLDATNIQSKDLIKHAYHGEVTLKFKDGMIVYMKKEEGIKLD